MLQTITWLRRFRKNRRGVSTVITVALSLVIVVVIVANVVLWSYTMNQFDMERMQENLSLTVTSRSGWFAAQSEYRLNSGSRTGGSYVNTIADDGAFETFRETVSPCRLDINGTFSINLAVYPLFNVRGIEILIKFRASDLGEPWFLKAYNWTSNSFGNSGFNVTSFAPTTTTGWDYYGVDISAGWASYVRSDDGRMFIQFHDNSGDGRRTTVRVDFLGVRVKTTLLSFQNTGSTTSHVVSVWVTNSSLHSRYVANFYINSGMNATFSRSDINLPRGQYTVKAVTERGNIFVYSGT